MSEMFTRWLALLLLLYISGVLSESNFPEDLYPKDISRAEFRNECPSESDKLDFCAPKYENCVGQEKLLEDCNMAFCKCVRIEEDLEEFTGLDSCANYSSNACFRVYSLGSSYKKTILRGKRAPVIERSRNRLEAIDEAVEQMANDCSIRLKLRKATNNLLKKSGSTNEILNFTAKYFALPEVVHSMPNLTKCKEAVRRLEKTMITVDDTSAKNLHLPYEFTHIGTEFGAIGKVVMRVLADEACEKATIDLNHHSVVRVNCYDQQNPREECDRKYIKNIKRVLSTMDSKKASCGMFVDLIEELVPVRAAQFYAEAANYHAESSMVSLGGKLNRGFSGFANGFITGRDTKNTILSLDATEKTSLRLLDYYDHVSSECGSARRVVSSCGFKYEYCTKLVQSECSVQLSICLNDIDDMNDACQNAVNKIGHVLWPTSENIPAVPLETLEQLGPLSKILIAAALTSLVFFIVFAIVFLYTRKNCRAQSDLSKAPSSLAASVTLNLSENGSKKDESGPLLDTRQNDTLDPVPAEGEDHHPISQDPSNIGCVSNNHNGDNEQPTQNDMKYFEDTHSSTL